MPSGQNLEKALAASMSVTTENEGYETELKNRPGGGAPERLVHLRLRRFDVSFKGGQALLRFCHSVVFGNFRTLGRNPR
jgi:hypothetical protein